MQGIKQLTSNPKLSLNENAASVFLTRHVLVSMKCSDLQEELKILRLSTSLLVKEELDTREQQLLHTLEGKKVLKQNSSNMVAEAKREADASKDLYEMYVAEDKSLDKNFRREFADQDQHTIDVLYKLFKRRPR